MTLTIILIIAVVCAAVFLALMFKGWKDGKDPERREHDFE
jgi:hypothetical protein